MMGPELAAAAADEGAPRGISSLRGIVSAIVRQVLAIRVNLVFEMRQEDVKDIRALSLPPGHAMESLGPMELAQRRERADELLPEVVLTHFEEVVRTGGRADIVCQGDALAYRHCVLRGPGRAVAFGRSFFSFGPDEWCLEFCETAQGARGRGIYPAALQIAARRAFAEGATKVWVATHRTNAASRRGILKAGFRQVRFDINMRLFHFVKVRVPIALWR
jgi:Acetyltransferase (GNAT) family